MQASTFQHTIPVLKVVTNCYIVSLMIERENVLYMPYSFLVLESFTYRGWLRATSCSVAPYSIKQYEGTWPLWCIRKPETTSFY
jgi:hypothetical protein